MHVLPPIAILHRRVWLPLSGGTARWLLHVLAGGGTQDEWNAAITIDPALAVWLLSELRMDRSISNVGPVTPLTPVTQRDLVQFANEQGISGKLADRLVWPADVSSAEWDFDSLRRDAAKGGLPPVRNWLRGDDGNPCLSSEAESKWMDDVWDLVDPSCYSAKESCSAKDSPRESPQANNAERGDFASRCGDWWRADATIGATLAGVAAKLGRAREIEIQFDRVLEKSKLDAMKELAYGASHEINNPLANISSRAQTLLVDETDPDRQRALAAINRQAFRAHEMIADMMLFAHPPRLEYTEFALEAVVDEVFTEMQPDIERQGTAVRYESPERGAPLVVAADRVQLGVVIKALVRNSLESLGQGGNIRVIIRRSTVPGDGGCEMCEISVLDDGPGIADEIRSHVFEPFFSGREAGRGLGFGLSKVWRIAEQHGGTVLISRTDGVDGGGYETCVSVHLPVRQKSPAADPTPAR